jgi:hypothetical protein
LEIWGVSQKNQGAENPVFFIPENFPDKSRRAGKFSKKFHKYLGRKIRQSREICLKKFFNRNQSEEILKMYGLFNNFPQRKKPARSYPAKKKITPGKTPES